MGRVRKFFAGSNTPLGFYSFFDQIIDLKQAHRFFILKGGPGTGKSTLMYAIAAELLNQGYDIEEFHCSSDAESLDGIAIPALKSAIVDGTAPHVLEPKYPGCGEQIIDLGQFWDQKALIRHRQEIVSLTNANKECYPRVYHYLRAAKELYDDTCAVNQKAVDNVQVGQVTKNLISEIFTNHNPRARIGQVRHLFAAAYTPQGLVDELSSIMDGYTVRYIIKAEPGAGAHQIMQTVVDHAVHHGFTVEAYHSPLDPQRIDHLALPELGIGIVSTYPPYTADQLDGERINLNDYLDHTLRMQYQHILHKNFVLFDELINLAIKQLRHAKHLHDQLEAYYIDHIDFSQYEHLKLEIVREMLRYEA